MRKIGFILLAICSIGMACEKKEPSLANTKWKLVGTMDVETGVLTEPKPENCADCYTLSFLTNDTLFVRTVKKGHLSIYEVDYKTNSFNLTYLFETLDNDTGIGGTYARLLRHIQSFSLQNKKKELWLYFNNKNNYLLFKKVDL